MTERRKFIEPGIAMTAVDYFSLSALARECLRTEPDLARDLMVELQRAKVLPAGIHPEDLVSIWSGVTFFNHSSGFKQDVTLVLPDQAHALLARISILSPLGIALIGLRVGQSVTWFTDPKRMTRLSVIMVRNASCLNAWTSRTTERPTNWSSDL
jgi:regulator of nucleoside diphosphate kinase